MTKKMAKINPQRFAHLMYLLQRGTFSRVELAERTGLHPLTVGDYLRDLHKQGVVYVRQWDQDAQGRHTIARYTLGMSNDVAKPAAQSRFEIYQRYRARRKAREAATFVPKTVWIGGAYAAA